MGVLEATGFSLVSFHPLLILPYSCFLGYELIYAMVKLFDTKHDTPKYGSMSNEHCVAKLAFWEK